MIAWPTWRVACSAAWNNRPITVDGRPARPTLRSSSSDSPGVRPQLVEPALDQLPRLGNDRRQQRRGVTTLPFRLRERALRIGQRLAARVGEQPIDRAGRVPDMEADRRRAAGTLPDLFRRYLGRQPLEILLDLDERVHHRHEERIEPGQRAPLPCFRSRHHRLL